MGKSLRSLLFGNGLLRFFIGIIILLITAIYLQAIALNTASMALDKISKKMDEEECSEIYISEYYLKATNATVIPLDDGGYIEIDDDKLPDDLRNTNKNHRLANTFPPRGPV